VACGRFILALKGISIFCHIFPFLLPFFAILRDFRSKSDGNGGSLFWGFSIGGVCAYVKLLQGLGVCVGYELLQRKRTLYR
jgi:hypothetical protein